MTVICVLTENTLLDDTHTIPFDQEHQFAPGVHLKDNTIVFESPGTYRVELWGELSPVVGTEVMIEYHIEVPITLKPLLKQQILAEDSRYWLRGQPVILPLKNGGELQIRVKTQPKVDIVAMENLQLIISRL